MGEGRWQKKPVPRLARSVYQTTLPPAREDLEYYVEARFSRKPAAPLAAKRS